MLGLFNNAANLDIGVRIWAVEAARPDQAHPVRGRCGHKPAPCAGSRLIRMIWLKGPRDARRNSLIARLSQPAYQNRKKKLALQPLSKLESKCVRQVIHFGTKPQTMRQERVNADAWEAT